jgi:hypothetical protein
LSFGSERQSALVRSPVPGGEKNRAELGEALRYTRPQAAFTYERFTLVRQ